MEAQILPFTRKTTTVRISPLAAFDGTEAVRILAKRFSIRPADEKFALHRVLSLVIVSADGGGQRVRVLKGTLFRRATGGGVTLTDSDGCVLGRNLHFSQLLAWSTDPSGQLEESTLKALHGIQGEIDAAFALSFAASMAELNTARRPARQLIAA